VLLVSVARWSVPAQERYLVGREPAGLVHRGSEVDALCASLERELLDIRDLDTGKGPHAQAARLRAIVSGNPSAAQSHATIDNAMESP